MTFKHLSPWCLLLTLVLSTSLFAQQKENGAIKGSITTNDGKPAAAVTVKIKGTTKAGLSDESGAFILESIKPGNYELEISLIGYQPLTQPVSVVAGKTSDVKVKLSVSNEQLQEVIITSARNKNKTANSAYVAKMPLSNLENPQSYSTVGRELIQQQAFFSADDAIRNVPGAVKTWGATSRANDGGAYYTLRGFTTQSALRNGMTGNVTTTNDAVNLERLEVIKGPSATLYGATLTSYGGLINRVTKKPYAGFGGEFSYSTGSYSLNRFTADINTPLDSAKTALLRINTAYNYSNSFQDNGFSKNFAFDPSFSYKINDKATLIVEAEINQASGTTAPIYYFWYGTTVAQIGHTSADQLPIDYKRTYQANDIVSTSSVANFFATLDYKISDQWKSLTAVSSTNNSSDGWQPWFYMTGHDSMSRWSWSPVGSAHTLQIQQNFTGDFHIGRMRNRFLGGVDMLNQRYSLVYNGSLQYDAVSMAGPNGNYYNFNNTNIKEQYNASGASGYPYSSNFYVYSAYVSDMLNITDRLMASASVRLDYFKTPAVSDPTANTTTDSYSQTTASPKFGLIYQVVKDKVSLFGNYMNGFKMPSFNAVYDASAPGGLANKLFKSERANQWEGGIKVDEFEGKLSGTLSYYDIQVKNISMADAQHANAYIQAGTQYSKGVEAEISANPFTGFNLIAGYAHNESKLTKTDADVDGRRPITAGPKDMANFWASYTLTQGKAKGLGIGLGGNYASKNYIQNSVSVGEFYLPSYTVLNAGVFYNHPKFRVGLNVNNLTNEKYWVGIGTLSPQMLRQIIGSVSYKF